MDDENNWSASQGEGITYAGLLRLPIYEDKDALPENITKKGSKLVYEEKPLNWDDYFEAIQLNLQVGFTSKFKNMKKLKETMPRQLNSDAAFKHDMYNDNEIEWDEIQETTESVKEKTTPKKYKMHFKEITEVEKNEIMKEIEKDEQVQPRQKSYYNMGAPVGEASDNMAGMLMSTVNQHNPNSKVPTKVFSVEEIETNLTTTTSPTPNSATVEKKFRNLNIGESSKQNEDFFNDEIDENEFAICKENTEDATTGNDTKVPDFAKVDVSKIKQIDEIESSLKASTGAQNDAALEQKAQAPEEISEKPSSSNIVSAEDLEKLHISHLSVPIEATHETENMAEVEGEGEAPSEDQMSGLHYSFQYQGNQSQYMNQQNDIQTQQMVQQLNQEEVQKVMLQNPSVMYQYQQEVMNHSNSHSPDMEVNPFENMLRENPTTQWFYKDPQGFVRGPFTCFDMYTWHSEGYFSEDLELSLDYANFFRLRDLRMYIMGQNQQPAYSGAQGYGSQTSSPGYVSHSPEMYSQYYPQSQMPAYYAQTSYGQYGQSQQAYAPSSPDYQQDYARQAYYYHANQMAGSGSQPHEYGHGYYGHQ